MSPFNLEDFSAEEKRMLQEFSKIKLSDLILSQLHKFHDDEVFFGVDFGEEPEEEAQFYFLHKIRFLFNEQMQLVHVFLDPNTTSFFEGKKYGPVAELCTVDLGRNKTFDELMNAHWQTYKEQFGIEDSWFLTGEEKH